MPDLPEEKGDNGTGQKEQVMEYIPASETRTTNTYIVVRELSLRQELPNIYYTRHHVQAVFV